jgi:CRP-like cAMP-binding protein
MRLSDSADSFRLGENRLLAALPQVQFYRLLPHLEPVSVAFRQILWEHDEAPEYAYFPLDSVVSLVSNMSDGKSVELAMIGKDGATGIFGVLGASSKFYEYRVQIPGRALRIKASLLTRELEVKGVLPMALMRYIPALCAQISQAAACNRLHKIEQRLSTWLLMMHNRISSDEIALRQGDIAATLGYRRPTITETCVQLQKRAAIRYSRGRITVLDRERLQEAACECYQIMEAQVDKTYEGLQREMAERHRPTMASDLFADVARISERIWRDHESVRRQCEQQRAMIIEQREWLRGLNSSLLSD